MAGAYMNADGKIIGGKGTRIPQPVLELVAEQLVEKLLQDVKSWGVMRGEERVEAMNLTRRILAPAWPRIAEYFDAQGNGEEANVNAANAITEIAIPALLHCEDKYDLSPNARVALETAMKSEDES